MSSAGTVVDEGDTIAYTESRLGNGTQYTFEVRAVFNIGNTDHERVGSAAQVYVTPAATPQPNRPPVFSPQTRGYFITANAPAGSALKSSYEVGPARVIATDPDGDSLSYALSGEFQSRFSISGSGNLTVAETPKLTIPEHTEVYLDVTVSDGNGGSARTWLKIDVDPDPNAPYVPPEVHGLSAQPGDGQATLIWLRPNIVNHLINAFQIWSEDAPTWTDIPGSGPATNTYTVSGLENGTAYKFRIRARSGDTGAPPTKVVIATPNKAQQNPPVITGLAYPGGEGYALLADNSLSGTSVVTVSASDPDAGDALTYTLLGEHASHFSIAVTAGKGVVTVKETLNLSLGTTVSLRVEVSDDTGLTARRGIGIRLKPAGEPVFNAPVLNNSVVRDGKSWATVVRDAAQDTVVATVSATDPDGQTLTYELLGSNEDFKIDSSGVIRTNRAFTFDAATSEGLLIEVADEDDNRVTTSTSIGVLIVCKSGEVMRGNAGRTTCQ